MVTSWSLERMDFVFLWEYSPDFASLGNISLDLDSTANQRKSKSIFLLNVEQDISDLKYAWIFKMMTDEGSLSGGAGAQSLWMLNMSEVENVKKLLEFL